MSPTNAAATAPPSGPHAWPWLGSSFQLACRCGLLSAQTRAADASHPLARWSLRSSPHPDAGPHPLALTLQLSPYQALSFRTFERDAKRAVDAVAAKVRTFSPSP